jgi:Nucleotidyl transferase AbiEii toxin, Type IV TA system
VSTEFPNAIGSVEIPVRVISAERTFWEKATILHQQANNGKPAPIRYARHYYDLAMLGRHGIAERAIGDLNLLQDVVKFKQRFYPSAAAKYELAVPGTFRLVPDEKKLDQLGKDYGEMQVMFFRETPSWATITEELAVLERAINDRVKVESDD